AACPRGRAREAGLAEMEARAAAAGTAHAGGADPVVASSIELPRLEFKALRLIPYGWGEGWQLRPSPPRRHWMDQATHAYQCLPMVIANQWGWHILCPTEVRVTWDGSTDLDGLPLEGGPH